MKRAYLAFALAATAAIGLSADGAKVEFDWAFVKQAPGGSIRPLDFKERVGIAPGDYFKIYIQPVETACVYLFLLDSGGELALLFPARFDDFKAKSYRNGVFFIPEGEEWFTLDGVLGVETFYLVASVARLGDLETRYAALDAAMKNPKAQASAKAALRQAVLDELARLRKQHSSLVAAAEKPVTIAGGTRGLSEAIQGSATRIAGDGFYIKTFRLEH